MRQRLSVNLYVIVCASSKKGSLNIVFVNELLICHAGLENPNRTMFEEV